MKHLLVRTEHSPHEADSFHARCGYVSGKKCEFVLELAKVTCEACLSRSQ